MEIRLYQVNMDRDENRVAFMEYGRYRLAMGTDEVESEVYDRVFAGDVDCAGLEAVYQRFNLDPPEGYSGRSMSVSDIVEVVNGGDVSPGFYFCDSVGFEKVEFDPERAQICEEPEITVVIVEPGKLARIGKVGTDLGSLQRAVGGDIEPFYCFSEPVCLVCDDEGKLNGKALNRAIYDEDGAIMDIIAGTFFICDTSGPSFGSLSREQQERYREKFLLPERFVRINGEIEALKYQPEKGRER